MRKTQVYVALDRERAAVRWWVTDVVRGRYLSDPEWVPLANLLAAEYAIDFSRGGPSPVVGCLIRTSIDLADPAAASQIIPFAGRIPQTLIDQYLQAIELVRANAPGNRQQAIALLKEVCDKVEERPFHSQMHPLDD